MSKAINSTIETSSSVRLKVLVTGTYTATDAYPNVKFRIQALQQDQSLDVKELPLAARTSLNYTKGYPKLVRLITLALRQIAYSAVCIVNIVRNSHYDILYIPYPAVPMLFLLSFVPRRAMPKRIVADAFISLYDTIVEDRSLLSKGNLPSELLRWLEQRALSIASIVITDTPENSRYIASTLDLPETIFQDLPLAIDERVFCPNDNSKTAAQRHEGISKCVTLLFVGTLVPLHRVDIIVEAIESLQIDQTIEITFIGDGQQAHLLQEFLANERYDKTKIKVTWIREWLSSESIYQHIMDTDICLGIMGHSGKGERVWPFKNYLYMACGKTLITARTSVTDRLLSTINYGPFKTVDTTNADDLTKQLEALITDSSTRQVIGSNANRYFSEHLCKAVNSTKLRTIISGR